MSKNRIVSVSFLHYQNRLTSGPLIIHEYVERMLKQEIASVLLVAEKWNQRDFYYFLKTYNPNIVAISFPSCDAMNVYKITHEIRRELPEAILIAGGVHPTLAPDEVLQYFDKCCVGEGETFFDELFCGENSSSKNGPRIFQAQTRIIDIDKYICLPPSFNNFYYSKGDSFSLVSPTFLYEKFYSGQYYSFTSRGCVEKCSYCMNSLITEKLYRNITFRNVEAVCAEISTLKKVYPQVNAIEFFDENFLLQSKEKIKQIMSSLTENKLYTYLSATPTCITKDVVDIFQQSPILFVQLGLQSASRKTARLYKREHLLDKLPQAIALLNKARINVFIHIIVNNPLENNSDIAATLNFLSKLKKPFLFASYSLQLYPGTALADLCTQRNIPHQRNKGELFAPPHGLYRYCPIAAYLPRSFLYQLLKHRHSKQKTLLLEKLATFLLPIFRCYYDFLFLLNSSRSARVSPLKLLRNHAQTWLSRWKS